MNRSLDYLMDLTQKLRSLPRETEWVEFKHNNEDPQEIGEYISALANSAALNGKAMGYVLWGISDVQHTIVGTSFSSHAKKVGNEDLENWLHRLLEPDTYFRFHEFEIEGKRLVLLEIERATHHPVRFGGKEFIRIGSYKKNLADHPDKEQALWRLFDDNAFESGIAAAHVRDEDVLGFLDYPSYFDLMQKPLPENRPGIIEGLSADNLITPCEAGGWNITNLGAILFAKNLANFPTLKRKSVRVIEYEGNSRIRTLREQAGIKGYAAGFEGLIEYINNLLPENEVIGRALRQDVRMYPELAIRELIANALIHQDFTMSGAGPVVEIFSDRIEITNPGVPLVDIRRFVDTPPHSRNEELAALMRRIGVCEERGSGWDKIVFETEVFQLPPPLVEIVEGQTRVALFAHRSLAKMDKESRIRAVYLHACLRHVNREHMTNTSVRERFGIQRQNIALASRIIGDTVKSGFIIPYDTNAAPKQMRYVPFWAAPSQQAPPT